MMNKTKRIFSFLFVLILVTVSLTFTGCPTSLQKIDGADFTNPIVAKVFGELFDKKPEHVTEEELAAIIGVDIITYGETNEFSIIFHGYDEAVERGMDSSDYVKTTDITGIVFGDLSDMRFLTSLKSFKATYTGFEDYNFLEPLKTLEKFESLYNYEAKDYSVFSKLPNLKSINIEGAIIDDYSFFKSLTSLETLSLSEVSFSEYKEFDASVVSGLTNLDTLVLSSVNLSDVTPLESLTNLKSLSLGRNTIVDVSPLAKLTGLTYLDLEQNLVADVSSLTTFDPNTFERIILDGNSSITDWSVLDYLGENKVQGKPIMVESRDLSTIYGTTNGMVKKEDLENVESIELSRVDDEYHLTLGFNGYLEAFATQEVIPEKYYSKIVLTESVEEFCEHFDAFINLRAFMSHGVDYENFDFLHKTKLALQIFEVVGNSIDADYSKLSEMRKLKFVSVTDSKVSDKSVFYSLENLDQLVLD